MLCAWFAGSAEGRDDTAIWLSQRHEERWAPPETVAKVGCQPHWNPVLHLAGETVHLFFKVGPTPRDWRTYHTCCGSLGQEQWSEPQELVAGDIGGRGPVKNKILVTESGVWLAPASIETRTAWNSFVDRSSDEGSSWQRSETVPRPGRGFGRQGIIQPTLWESHAGRIHMLTRSSAGRVYRSDSSNDGKSWCSAYPTELPNNNSGIDLVKLPGGRLALAHNPVSGRWAARTPLSLSLSSDQGQSWHRACDLEDDRGEFSYPAIVATRTGLAVSYTWKRQHIHFQSFALEP